MDLVFGDDKPVSQPILDVEPIKEREPELLGVGDSSDLGPLYELYYMRHQKPPSREQLCREFKVQYSVETWENFFSTKKNQVLITDRGVPLPDGTVPRITPRQLEWIHFLMNPGNTGSMSAKAKSFGINLHTHYEWLKNPLFAEALRHETTKLAAGERMRVIGSLVQEAATGNVQAQKLYLELTGEYRPGVTVTAANANESRVMVAKLVEVLQRHLTSEQLEAVSLELEAVLFPETRKYTEAIMVRSEA